MTIRIGVIGGGFVGKATSLFKNSKNEVYVYDLQPSLCIPPSTTMEDIYTCDVVFVCVPTPMRNDGSCHTTIVESVVRDLQSHSVRHIVIRSTVPVGLSQSLGVHFMPEFLTEKNWAFDFANCECWVVGTDIPSNDFKSLMIQIIHQSYQENILVSPNIEFISTKEAELVKYIRNCFLATKIGFFNEIFTLSERLGVEYDVVRRVSTRDSRIGSSHSSVPGHDGRRGYGGTCFPKDMASFIYQFSTHGVPSPILSSVQERNLTMDRPEQDWTEDEGRAVVSTND